MRAHWALTLCVELHVFNFGTPLPSHSIDDIVPEIYLRGSLHGSNCAENMSRLHEQEATIRDLQAKLAAAEKELEKGRGQRATRGMTMTQEIEP